MRKPMLYCDQCDNWTHQAPPSWGGVRCGSCGEDFTCGECGFEVDSQGNCQRPVVTGDWCPSDGVEP